MAFDIEMIKKVYANMPSRIEAARKTLGRPLTLAEKILYSHLDASFDRGSSKSMRLPVVVGFKLVVPKRFCRAKLALGGGEV